MDINATDFLNVLHDRIEAIRPGIAIDPKKQLHGMRFKNTTLAIEAVQGALIVSNNPGLKDKAMPEASGIFPHRSDVLTGQFDPLIRLVLTQYSIMDFEAENSIDLH